MYEHILIASHGSELTQRATTQGLELAKVTDVTVTELGRRLSPEGWRREWDSNSAFLLSIFDISSGLPTSLPTNRGSVRRTDSGL